MWRACCCSRLAAKAETETAPADLSDCWPAATCNKGNMCYDSTFLVIKESVLKNVPTLMSNRIWFVVQENNTTAVQAGAAPVHETQVVHRDCVSSNADVHALAVL